MPLKPTMKTHCAPECDVLHLVHCSSSYVQLFTGSNAQIQLEALSLSFFHICNTIAMGLLQKFEEDGTLDLWHEVIQQWLRVYGLVLDLEAQALLCSHFISSQRAREWHCWGKVSTPSISDTAKMIFQSQVIFTHPDWQVMIFLTSPVVQSVCDRNAQLLHVTQALWLCNNWVVSRLHWRSQGTAHCCLDSNDKTPHLPVALWGSCLIWSMLSWVHTSLVQSL